MDNSRFTQENIDFKESRMSEYSKYGFDIKSQPFEVDESINKSIIDRCISEKNFSNTPEGNKKLYLNDLETHKENSDLSKFSAKENNITVTHQGQPQSFTQSRKITLHKNPYRNVGIDDSFTTNKICQLQEELLEVRKELSMKESSWIKEKSILLNKIELFQYDLAEAKQRNNNLIQINQTLTQALGETNKQTSSESHDKKIEELNKEIQSKNKKIQSLEDSLSKNEKEKINFEMKIKEEREKNEVLTKHIEDYKTILKESNQRKFESDEKILILNKNIEILKKKLTELPIKESYLHPIFAFLESMKSNNYSNHITEQSSYLEISDVKRPKEEKSFFMEKNKYQNRDSSFLQINQNFSENENNFIQENSGCYENEESYAERESNFTECNKRNSYFVKPQKNNSKLNLFNRQVKRIDTDDDQEEVSNAVEFEDEEEVYLCEICQRVYPHEEFMSHLKECQEYEALLKQKKAIESKLISIKEQEYDNRKSSGNSLNSSAILMNKSKSKGKFIKPSENGHRIDKAYDRQSDTRKYSNNNGNKTERGLNQELNECSRLELSELMNISEISNRQSILNQKGQPKKIKKGLINPNNYFSSGVENQENFDYHYHQENVSYKPKPNPEIKYQTHIPQQCNMIGKESMQEEIRRIVEAMNEGRKSVSKQNGGFQKMNNKQTNLGENRSLTSRNNAEKNDRRESHGNGRNYDKASRNKVDLY